MKISFLFNIVSDATHWFAELTSQKRRQADDKREEDLARKHLCFHQLNGRKQLVFFNPAISKGLQLHSQILNFTISNGTQNAISFLA